MINEYEAVVLDNDGVLVEPTDTDVIVDAVVDSFEAFGVDIDRSLAGQSTRVSFPSTSPENTVSIRKRSGTTAN